MLTPFLNTTLILGTANLDELCQARIEGRMDHWTGLSYRSLADAGAGRVIQPP